MLRTAISRVVKELLISKDDLIRIEGTVAEARGQGNYCILLTNGIQIAARLCGKMRRFKIRIIVGDKVTVGLSPYDTSHGLIVHRH
jgi:translation initiation factor IF-1